MKKLHSVTSSCSILRTHLLASYFSSSSSKKDARLQVSSLEKEAGIPTVSQPALEPARSPEQTSESRDLKSALSDLRAPLEPAGERGSREG